MATPTNHWKLGLFVLLGVFLSIATVGVLGARSLRHATDNYVSYFDESVQGLEVGSPIKFRGVTIGAVEKIDVAPDHRHVEVTSALGKAELSRLGLDVSAGWFTSTKSKRLVQAIDLRVQLTSSGLTGVKFLQLDFFPVADHPRPELSFPVPKNYIPATSSTLRDLELSMVRTMASLPKITERVTSILGRIEKVVVEVGERKLVAKGLAVIAATGRVVDAAQRKLAQLHPAQVSAGLRKMFGDVGGTARHVSALLERIASDKGLLRSVLLASNAFGDTARAATRLGGQLDDTLRAVKGAAKSIHTLARALEKEPDMLVKGRVKQ